MADNIDIKDAAEATKAVATDDAGAGGHVQLFKLAISANGDATLIPADAANGLDVDVTRLPDATVVGKAAHDAAASGNPVLLGAKALAIGQATSDVSADGDATNLLTTRGGRLYVCNAHPNRWSACHEETGAVTNHEIKAAPAAGLSLYLTDVVYNAAVAATLKLLDGSGGTTLLYLPSIAAGGGLAYQFHTPIKLTAATGLFATTTGAGNHGITVSGFTSA